MTENIEPYEFMKLFLLNVPHSCIAYSGLTKNYIYVHQAMNDDQLRTDLFEMVKTDIFPILELHIPESIDWNEYWRKTVNRFRNEYMCDTLERISRDGLEKLKKQGLRLLAEGKKIGLSMNKFKIYLNLWAKYLDITL
jgi:mannitol-1-phosphate/altronate dehydrogenase